MKKQLQPIMTLLLQYRNMLITVLILAISGYTVYQISLVVAVTPDPVVVQQEADKTVIKGLKFDNVTIKAITQQQDLPVKPNLDKIGTTNPFLGN